MIGKQEFGVGRSDPPTEQEAKYWLESVALARAGRFVPHELREIERILVAFQQELLLAWEREQAKRAHG